MASLARYSVLLLCVLTLSAGVSSENTQRLAARASNVPAPVVIAPSQNFEGNDGPWSTFTLQLGTPAQDVTAMVSTAGWQTWAVVPQGCPSSAPANCVKARGGVFQYNESSTWQLNTVNSNGNYTLGMEENLGYSGNGVFGYDTVALGWQGSNGPSLDHQIVAGIATPEFYLGQFGLDPQPTNFTNFNNPVASYMSNLKNQSMIPSLSWGYTAGNQYRLNKQNLGSLTLGGYDTSLFEPNDLVFQFSGQVFRELTVQIASITHTAKSKNTSLLSTPIPAFVDSTIPWIYLPVDACEKFEQAFGIVWSAQNQAYLVNDTLHEKLLSQDATVTFTLQNATGSAHVDIALPYAAFDLTAKYPLVENSTRYFPLTRAENSSQYTLGRTFFQEAYVITDYERRTFSVSQCTWNADAQQHITTIKSLSTDEISKSSKSNKLSGGAIAGIVIGSILGVAVLAALGYFIHRKMAGRRREPDGIDKPELDSTGKFPPELKGDTNGGAELDSKQQLSHEIDSTLSPGHEIDGKTFFGHELGGDRKTGHELDSGQNGAAEMAAREAAAAELP